jgi:MarR family transcriptional regulator, negative regulator of the multidrug operon emrRAB
MSHAYDRRGANLLGALGLAVADRLTDSGAGASTSEALVALHGRRSGITIDALAGITGLTHSGAVRLVDRLTVAELLERRRGADQRSVTLYLTPPGRRAARRVLERRETAMHSMLAELTDVQRAGLVAAAEQILGELGSVPGVERRLCRLCDLESCGRARGRCPVVIPPRDPNTER